MVQGVFHGAVLGNQLQGRFGAYSRYPGDVVAGIPHEPFQVDDLPGFQSLVFFPEGLFVIDGNIGNPFFGEQHLDIVFNQLEFIPIPGDDPDLDTVRSPAGQGADNIIRFVVVHFQGGDPHGLEQSDGQRELFLQFRGRSLPLALIVREFFRSEGFPGFVESHQHVAGFDLLEQLQDHIAQAVHRPGVDPFSIGQRRQSKESPVDQAAAVDKKEFFVHCAPSSVLF